MSSWLVIGVESAVFWPTKETKVNFRGKEIVLRPSNGNIAPSVALNYDASISFEDAVLCLRRFLSSLAWVEKSYIRETMITGGSHPFNVGRERLADNINSNFNINYLPEPEDQKAQLALALYREALSINSIPYSILGYFKIINIKYSNGNNIKNWIDKSIPFITDFAVKKRLETLKQDSSMHNISEYLYGSCRCAVAHAFSNPVVDPEDPKDAERLTEDLPLIKALAEYLIENEFDIKSYSTYKAEHF